MRALLLLDSASIVALNAAVLAGDMGYGGPGLAASVRVGGDIVFALCMLTLCVLLGGFGWHAFKSAEAEQAAIDHVERAAAAARFEAPTQPRVDTVDADVRVPGPSVAVTVSQHILSEGFDNPLLMAPRQVTTAQRGSKGSRSRQRQRGERRAALKDPGLAAASASLSDLTTSAADLTATCSGVLESLSRLTADDAQAASAALLPGLSARLEVALREGTTDSGVLAATCGAMAALSDHADAATHARLVKAGVPEQLVLVLRQEGPPARALDAREPPPPVLAQAMWLLGNLAADESAATAFSCAGGSKLLVELLSSVVTAAAAQLVPAGDSQGAAGRHWAEAALHTCVAVASITAHCDAAAALLDAGVLCALARCLLPDDPYRRAHVGMEASGGPTSVADAEAACHAIANLLRHPVDDGRRRRGDAGRISRALVGSNAIAGCTAALRYAIQDHALSPAFESCSLAGHAAEALLSIVRYSSLGAEESTAEPVFMGDAASSDGAMPATSILVTEAKEAGTAEAVLALERALYGQTSPASSSLSVPVKPSEGGPETGAAVRIRLGQVLQTLSTTLPPWLAQSSSLAPT